MQDIKFSYIKRQLFKDVKIGDVLKFDPAGDYWTKNSSRTVKLMQNNRIFYVSKEELVWLVARSM